jgi:mannose/fructose/N-acetylgalactosamine-specific phosphotransferase system component IID
LTEKLTPEDIKEMFALIRGLHKSFSYQASTTAGWLAAMTKLCASKEEIKSAIIDHAMSEDGKYEPKIAHIVANIRRARGVF